MELTILVLANNVSILTSKLYQLSYNFLHIISDICGFFLNFNISNWIATVALLVSLFTLWKSRKHISVDWPSAIHEAKIGEIFLDLNASPMQTIDFSYMTTLSIINSSPVDVDYFDLRAFDPKKNLNLYLITRKSLHGSLKGMTLIQNLDPNHGAYTDTATELDIPERNHGVLKANSFTSFNLIVMVPSEELNKYTDLKSIVFSFKIPKRTFFRKDPYAVTTRKKFKVFSKEYQLDPNWLEKRKQQLLEKQVQAAVQESQPKSQQTEKFQVPE